MKYCILPVIEAENTALSITCASFQIHKAKITSLRNSLNQFMHCQASTIQRIHTLSTHCAMGILLSN